MGYSTSIGPARTLPCQFFAIPILGIGSNRLAKNQVNGNLLVFFKAWAKGIGVDDGREAQRKFCKRSELRCSRWSITVGKQKSRIKNASHQAADFREPAGRHSCDAGSPVSPSTFLLKF